MLGWALNLGFAASGEEDAPVVPKKGGRTRRRIQYVVEIDGQVLEASSLNEAIAILDQARELAETSAPKDVRTAPHKVRIKPPKVSIKTAIGGSTTSTQLGRAVKDAQSRITEIYRKAQRELEVERELSKLIQKKIRDEDDEEAITALLL